MVAWGDTLGVKILHFPNTAKTQVIVLTFSVTQKINLGPLRGNEKDKEDFDNTSLSLIFFKALLT